MASAKADQEDGVVNINLACLRSERDAIKRKAKLAGVPMKKYMLSMSIQGKINKKPHNL